MLNRDIPTMQNILRTISNAHSFIELVNNDCKGGNRTIGEYQNEYAGTTERLLNEIKELWSQLDATDKTITARAKSIVATWDGGVPSEPSCAPDGPATWDDDEDDYDDDSDY